MSKESLQATGGPSGGGVGGGGDAAAIRTLRKTSLCPCHSAGVITAVCGQCRLLHVT